MAPVISNHVSTYMENGLVQIPLKSNDNLWTNLNTTKNHMTTYKKKSAVKYNILVGYDGSFYPVDDET